MMSVTMMRPALRRSSLLVACAGLTLVVVALCFASSVEAAELVAVVDIAGDAPWSRIVRAFDQLAQLGVADLALRFARPPLARPFAKTPLDDELAAIAARSDPADKATRIAQLNLRVFARCRRMSQVLGALAAASPDTRARLLLTGIDELLDDPACVVDPPSVQALAWAMLGGRALQTFSIHIDRKAKLRVHASPASTWHEVVATGQLDTAFAKRGTPVFFVAR
jgi:hypothetical protein